MIFVSTALWLCPDDIATDSNSIKSISTQLIVAVRSCASDFSCDDELRISVTVNIVLDVQGLGSAELIFVGDFSGRVRINS